MFGNHYYFYSIKVLAVLVVLYSLDLLLDQFEFFIDSRQVMLQEKKKNSKDERAHSAIPHPSPHAYSIYRTLDGVVIDFG